MPTKKQRLNLSLPKHVAVFLKKISLKDDVPQATKAVQLLEQIHEREKYLTHARAALGQAQRGLTQFLRRSYPALTNQAEDAIRRLASPAYYEERIRQARQEYRLADAQRWAAEVLKRHSNTKSLWEQLLDIVVQRGDVTALETSRLPRDEARRNDHYQQARELLVQMESLSVGTAFTQSYWTGQIHERLAEWPQAKVAYAQAQLHAGTEKDRISARSKEVLMNLRLARNSDSE